MTVAERLSQSLRAIVWSRHAYQEAENDKISTSALEEALRSSCTLVEHYPEDPQGESILVLTFVGSQTVHVVLSPREDFCYLITVYLPAPERWDQTFTRRRR